MPDYKTLIINGSPRPNGSAAQIINYLTPQLRGVTRFDAYKANIAPCVDCRACHTAPDCVIKDDFDIITGETYTHTVLVSPVYLSVLTPPLMSLATRFQADYCAQRFLGQPIPRPKKRALVILTGGGDGSAKNAAGTAKWIMRWLNADITDILTSLNTDAVPALEDADFIKKLDAAVRLFYG